MGSVCRQMVVFLFDRMLVRRILWTASSQSAGPTLGAAQTEHVGVTALCGASPSTGQTYAKHEGGHFYDLEFDSTPAKRLQGPTLGSQFCECMSVALFHTLSMHACSKRNVVYFRRRSSVSGIPRPRRGIVSAWSVPCRGSCQAVALNQLGTSRWQRLDYIWVVSQSWTQWNQMCAISNTTHQVLFHGGQSGAASWRRKTFLLFQVGLNCHSIKTSEADLPCLSATVTTFHIHDLTLFHVCVITSFMSGSMTTHHSNRGGPHRFRTGSLQHDAFPKCCSSSTRTVFTRALLADKRKGCRCLNHQEVILIATLSNWKS